jgi:hypothetical protein
MARSRKSTRRKTSRSRRSGLSGASYCGCPTGSKKISTKGRGRGWVCQSTSFKTNRNGMRYKPFVKAKRC